MEKLNLLLQDGKKQWLLSFFVTFIFFVFVFFTNDLIFSTNDDSRILYALAGYATGELYPKQPFINYFLGCFISLLYYLNSAIPWYGLFHVCSLLFSIVVIFKCLYKIFYKLRNGIVFAIFIHIILLISIFYYPIVALQFTTTSAIIGTSTIPVILSLEPHDNKKTYILSYVYCLFALILSFMTRSLSWYSVMAFFGLACLYKIYQFYMIENTNIFKVTSICFLIVFITASCILLKITSVNIKNNNEVSKNYNEYNEYRVKYMDYEQHNSYNDDVTLYNSVNWSENTYKATLCLLYFDENINLDSFQKITDNYVIGENEKITNSLNLSKNLITQNVYAQVSILISIIIFIIIELFSKNKICKIFIFICQFITFILFIYLSINGRLPLRSFMSLIIPNICLLITFLAFIQKDICFNKNTKLFLVLVSILSVSLSIKSIYVDKDYLRTQTKTKITQEEFDLFEKYAIQNPNHFYVYDFSVATVNRDPFKVFPDEKPINTMISGGSFTYSELYYQQLEANGLKQLFWEDLLKDNIYYVSANVEYVDVIKRNIEENLKKEIGVKKIKQIGNTNERLIIYKFSSIK